MLQILLNKHCEVKSYSDPSIEVDILVESEKEIIAVEVKLSKTVKAKMFRNLNNFSELTAKPVKKHVVYTGKIAQKFNSGLALPYQDFLNDVVPEI